MANARLRMARQAGKRRRSSDLQPAEEPAAETPGESTAENDRDPLKNEPQTTPTGDVTDTVHEAFQAQKQAIEERLHALTMGKPLPKSPEPGFDVNGVRLKRAHRDFLLQEMEWMAADFAQERKWRLKSARVLSLSVVSFHSKQATRAARQQKMEEEAKRRLAARIGRDVKKFWTKIDKIISYKVKLQADELRKAAMDKHLKHLVSQTERYASALAMTFQEAHGDQGEETTAAPHQERFEQIEDDGDDDDRSDRKRTGELEEHKQCGDDAEQQQRIQGEQKGAEDDGEQSVLDQKREADTTQDGDSKPEQKPDGAEQAESRATDGAEDRDSKPAVDQEEPGHKPTADEVESSVQPQLSRDSSARSRRSVRRSAAITVVKRGGEGDNSVSSDSDYAMPSDDEKDDEETVAIDEQMTTKEEVDEEMALLEEEGELSIEELRARYAAAFASGASSDEGEEAEDVEEGEHAESEEVGDVAGESSGDDGDFEPSADEVEDDERTIEAAERNGFTAKEVDEEMRLLQEEGELPIEELRARYAVGAASENEQDMSDEEESQSERIDGGEDLAEEEEDDDDDDFQPTDEEPDDETTIAAAEQNGLSREEIAEEVSLLREEGELSIEELRARYASAGMNGGDEEEGGGSDSEGSDVEEDEASTSDSAEHCREVSPDGEAIEDGQLVVVDTRANSSDSSAAQRRSSLSITSAPATGFKRPYLLTSRLSLREYQEAGVNWLVSMCEKRINGILADEMGLGKTIQTISLLAHLACNRGIWGPHLIVVPTSCLVNWEMEFKRWCPAFKVLTYFGSAKRRKELRQGWSKQNAFQICITSYQLVVQDAHCFKRKKWYYLILDEAHNIKNWKSLRWQTLLNFNSQRRLLLTGTPLQNNIMELWSLMHFLMPHVFSSRREFTYWFQNPLASMVEGEQDVNNQLVTQLHGIIRPFVLRRLKKDVAKQMPGKFEHVVTCKLSKRQRFLYEDFISRSSTRRAMFGSGRGKGGGGTNFMSMMNVLMQLRKVCNHPDLFEPRPIASPFDMSAIRFHAPSRCGFLMSDLVNEGRDLPFWSHTQNLPNLEIAGYEKYTSSRWRQLYYYDVNAPLPPETSVSDEAKEQHGDKRDIIKRLFQLAEARKVYWQQKRNQVAEISRLRVELTEEPMYGSDLIRACTLPVFISHAMDVHVKRKASSSRAHDWLHLSDTMSAMVKDPEDRVAEMTPIVTRAVCFVPKARARPVEVIYGGSGFASHSAVSKQEFVLSRKLRFEALEEDTIKPIASKCLDVYYDAFKRTQLFFPDKRLVQFDCGKLQQLDMLLRELKRGNHRCLIFTQMSSMLNILEIFLNIHGHTYFRLDGSTKVEKRQSLMDRFNRDEKIFCFILSTRSGGLGINLTGADSVIFYDSDWNPAMDAQAQDRAHRIGQTRDVHIYRLVSEHTVEENILKKAQQKRHLDFLVMAEGQFTTDFFSKANLRELVTGNEALPEEHSSSAFVEEEEEAVDEEDDDEGDQEEPEMSYEALEDAMAQIEDEEDVVAMKGAKEEFMSEQREFEEEAANSNNNSSGTRPSSSVTTAASASVAKPSTPSSMSVTSSVSGKDDDEEEDTESVDGSVAAPADETTETQYGDDADAPVTNDSVEQASDDDEEGGAEASSGESDDSIDDDDDDEIVQAGRKRKRANARTAKNTSRQTKSRRQNGDTATTKAQQQRASDRAKEKARDKQIEMEEERKLQAWKDSVSSLKGFEDSLNPVDRYALHFREQIDPLYAYVPTAAAIESYFDSQHGKLDIEKIEEEKMVEEANLIADGELIAGIMDPDGDVTTMPVDGDGSGEESQQYHQQKEARIEKLHRALYKKERAHVHSERRRRQLTGAAWEIKKCAITNQPFFFNVDTREAIWDRPTILAKNEQFEHTRQLGYPGLMPNALLAVMKCLSPYPDRHHAQLVCKSWRQAANHPSLFLKVNANDLYSRGVGLSQLLSTVALGDTVIFGSGVYHLDGTVEVKTPIKLLAAPDSHVELQMTRAKAQLRWTARGGMLCGFHLTRQSHADGDAQVTNKGGGGAKSSSSSSSNWQNLLHVVNGGQVRVMYCDFDGSHQGNACIAVSGSTSSRAVLLHNRIYNGGSSGVLLYKGDLVMVLNSVYANTHSGVSVLAGNALLRRNKIQKNGRFGIRLLYHAGNIIIEENIVNDNPCGNIDTENSGRRFVVRWNEMSKDEPDDLPHSHGKLLLKTFQIVEREIPRKSSTPSTNRVHTKPPVANCELPQATDSTAGIASTLPAASAITIPPTVENGCDPALTVSAAAVVVTPSQDSNGGSAVKTEVPEPGEASGGLTETVEAAEAPANQVSDVEMASTSEVAVTNAGGQMVVSVADSKPASVEATKPPREATISLEPVPAVNSVPGIGETSAAVSDSPTTTTTAQPPTTISTTTPTSTTTTAGATTTSTTALAQPAATTPVKLKRKRRPKMEKLLVDGRVIVFQDTCEKRGDKVKKPRQFKLKAAEAAAPPTLIDLCVYKKSSWVIKLTVYLIALYRTDWNRMAKNAVENMEVAEMTEVELEEEAFSFALAEGGNAPMGYNAVPLSPLTPIPTPSSVSSMQKHHQWGDEVEDGLHIRRSRRSGSTGGGL